LAPSRGWTATAALALLLLFFVSGCQQRDEGPRWRAAGGDQPRRGGTLRFSTANNVRSLDPAIAYDEVSFYAEQHLYDTLVGYPPARPARRAPAAPSAPTTEILAISDAKARLQLTPQLAESWTISEDGLRLRFVLRPGLRYHDGQPILAGDFKYALERVLRTADSPFGGFLTNVAGAQELREGKALACSGLRVLDDRQLEITLKTRDASFLYMLAMKFATPLRKDHVLSTGAELRRRPLASGPYMLASWKEGQRLVLVRNPYHWDEHRGYIDELQLLENIPSDVQLLMFERGELDTCFQPMAPDYLWLVDQPRWAPYIHRVGLMNVFGERINVTRPPFHDVRVRRALNYAFNKHHTTRLLYGTATIAHGMLPPGMLGRDDALQPYPYDPARAKQLLAEAGYPDGFETEYVTLSGDEPRKLAASLQADLAQVGIRLKIVVMSIPAYQSAVASKDGPPLSFTSWTQDYPDPTNFFDMRFHSRLIAEEGSLNDSFYADPAADALMDQARAERDPERRAALYRQLERLLYDAAPWIWGYHRAATEIIQPYLLDYTPHPVWIRDFSSSWLDLDREGRRVPVGAR
jgi:ABC-type transport system substrate-binding protein